MGKLDGKTIIITGGAKGQGAAEVKLATALGAQVVVTDTVSYTHLTLPTILLV